MSRLKNSNAPCTRSPFHDRQCEGGMEPDTFGGRRSGEVVVACDVGYPGGLAILPDASRQADAPLECGRHGGPGELIDRESRGMPGPGAAHARSASDRPPRWRRIASRARGRSPRACEATPPRATAIRPAPARFRRESGARWSGQRRSLGPELSSMHPRVGPVAALHYVCRTGREDRGISRIERWTLNPHTAAAFWSLTTTGG